MTNRSPRDAAPGARRRGVTWRLSALGLLALSLCLACASDGDKPDKGGDEPARELPEREVSPVVRELADPQPPRRESPILVETEMFIMQPTPAEDRRYQAAFKTIKILRGEFLPHTAVRLDSPRQSFPWIRGGEYAGAKVFLHVRKRRGQYRVEGFSQTATGVVYPLR